MSDDLDGLFGEGGGQVRPALPKVWIPLASGLVLSVLGLACTTVPGGLLVLLAWMFVEKEMDRLESGFLPAHFAPVVERMRWIVYFSLVFALGLFLVQFFLLCFGFYDQLWGWALSQGAAWFEEPGELLPPAP